MTDREDVAAFALALPGTELSTSCGQPALKVAGKMLVSTGHEIGSFHLRSPHEGKAVLIATDPTTFWQRPRYGTSLGLLVRYGSADAKRVAVVIRPASWDAMTPAKRKVRGHRA